MSKIKNKKIVKRTVLLYCEGCDDKVFLEYLRSIFGRNDDGVKYRIKENYGCEANGVLTNVRKQILADKTFCIYDADTDIDLNLKKKVEKCGIICIENKPCLEAFLLAILECSDYSNHCTCDKSKKEFENKYLDEKKRKDKRNYKKFFPKKLLEERSKDVKNLKMLIDIFSS